LIKMDLVRFASVEGEEFEMLIPWRSLRMGGVVNPVKKELRRLFIYDAAKFSENFTTLYYTAFLNIMGQEKQHGINLHGMRHIVAVTHLEENPGDYVGAAAKLNDDIEQIIKTYGDRDRSKAMRRASEDPYLF